MCTPLRPLLFQRKWEFGVVCEEARRASFYCILETGRLLW